MQANTPNRAHPLKCVCTHNSTGAHQENHRGTKSALFRFLSTTIFFVSLFQCSFLGYRAEYYLKRASKYHRSRRRRSSIFFCTTSSLFFLFIIIIDVTIIVGCRAVLFFLHGFLSLPLRCLCKPWLYAHCHRLSRCSHWMWTLHFWAPCQRPTSSLPYRSVLTSIPTHLVVKLWHTAIRERNISKRIT